MFTTMDSILSQWHIFNFLCVSKSTLPKVLCQCTPLYPSGPVPKHVSISQWHYVKVYIYFLVALCQCIHILVALCQCIRLFSSGTMPMYTSIFLLHCANTNLYDYFPVALWQYLLIHVCILIVLRV